MTEDRHLPAKPVSEIVLCQTEDGHTRVQVRLENETVRLPQRQIAELCQVSVPAVNEHSTNIYTEGELDSEATIRKFRIVQNQGNRSVTRAGKVSK